MADPGDTDNGSITTSDDDGRVPAITLKVLGVASAFVILAVVAAFIVLVLIPRDYLNSTSTVVILLIGGVIAVMLLLYFGAVILASLGVGSRKAALGMPEGSVRALIAVSLILMFAIIGLTVLGTTQGGDQVESKGLTADQIDQLENVQIISISVVDPAASPGEERFNVVARPELTQAGHDFGLQLLTTVATLVAAVSAFYFGSKSAGDAAKAALAIQRAATSGTAATAATATATDELGEEDLIEAREEGAAEDQEDLGEADEQGDLGEADEQAMDDAKMEAGKEQPETPPEEQPETPPEGKQPPKV